MFIDHITDLRAAVETIRGTGRGKEYNSLRFVAVERKRKIFTLQYRAPHAEYLGIQRNETRSGLFMMEQ